MQITLDLFKETWLYQEGVEEGEVMGIRSSLHLILGHRFPLEQFREIEQVQEPKALANLLMAALEVQTPDAVRAAILAAIRLQ